MKNAIDDHIARLFDAILASLRRGIVKDQSNIEQFLSDAMDALSTRPQTVDEIGTANAKHKELGTKKNEVRTIKFSVIKYLLMK